MADVKKLDENKKQEEQQKKLAHLEGLDKFLKMHNDWVKEYQEALKAMRDLGDIMQLSVYQEKEKDWAILGGIADGIAGPGAGAATAVNAMLDNVKIREQNAANRRWGAQQNMNLQLQANELAKKAPRTLTMEQVQQQYEVVMAWKPETLFKQIRIQEKKAEIDPQTKSVVVSVIHRGVKGAFRIDGALRAMIYTEKGEFAGCAYLPLPRRGIKRTGSVGSLLNGICAEPLIASKAYTVEVEPLDLWELIDKEIEGSYYPREENLSLEEHRKLVAESEKRLNTAVEQHRLKEEDREKERIAKRDKKLKKIGICAGVAVVAIIAGLFVSKVILPRNMYSKGGEYEESGDYANAAIAFGKAGSYSDAQEHRLTLWEDVAKNNQFSSRSYSTYDGYAWTWALICSDGTVAKLSDSDTDTTQKLADWNDIVDIAVLDDTCIAGLHSDGTVSATNTPQYNSDSGWETVSEWADIVEIRARSNDLVGLKSDGTLVTTDTYHSKNLKKWKNIISFESDSYVIGLRSDGTVVANTDEQGDLDAWSDIVDIATSSNYATGLKNDGTVVAAEHNEDADNWEDIVSVDEWEDIISVICNSTFIAGLKSDGTVVISTSSIDVSDWSNIVSIDCGEDHVVGLKSDGTVLAAWTESKKQEESKVKRWTDIADVYAFHYYIIGVRTDGSIIKTDYNWKSYI